MTTPTPRTLIHTLATALCAILLLSACSTARHGAKATPQAPQPQTAQTASPDSTSWQRIRVPFKLRIQQPEKINTTGTAIMVRDSSVTLGFRVIVFELLLVHATGDSILILNKFHKEYIAESTSDILADVPLSVADLQAVLTGQVPPLNPASLPVELSYTRAANGTGLTAIDALRPDGKAVNVSFTDPTDTPHGTFPGLITITSPIGNKTLNAEIEYQWGKAKWDSDVTLRDTTIPEDYTKVTHKSIRQNLPVK